MNLNKQSLSYKELKELRQHTRNAFDDILNENLSFTYPEPISTSLLNLALNVPQLQQQLHIDSNSAFSAAISYATKSQVEEITNFAHLANRKDLANIDFANVFND